MDFVSDSLFNGQRIRALTVVDNFSRECLAIHADHSIRAALDKWAYEHKVVLDFSRPGKPTDNAYIESFNGSFRDKCLNTHWFLSLDDAREKIEAWRRDYEEGLQRVQAPFGA